MTTLHTSGGVTFPEVEVICEPFALKKKKKVNKTEEQKEAEMYCRDAQAVNCF